MACLLVAVGELLGVFVLVHFIPHLSVLHPVWACGFAAAMMLIAGICLLGSKILAPISRKYEEELDHLD